MAPLFFSGRALAGSTATSLGSTANVVSDCKITNSPLLQFGNYVSATGTTATASISVECGDGTAATVGLDQGTNQNNLSTCTTTRAMNNINNKFLCYELYTNAADTTVWNNTTNTVALNFASFGVQSATIYGKIPSGQAPGNGAYVDFVGIVVSF